MRTIIIDDEEHCTETLSLLLKAHCPELEVVAVTNDSREGVELINSHRPDLIFLDIEMPYLDGFDVLKTVDNSSFGVIFTTAYDEFAIRAIKHSALDYLLKPIDRTELQQAVVKALAQHKKSEEDKRIDRLFEHLETDKDRTVALPTLTGLELVAVRDIIRCEADNNYTSLYLQGAKKMVVSKPLKEIEQVINSRVFIRPHQSHLVNIREVVRYVKSQGGYLELKTGDSVPISRSKREEVVEWLRSGL